MCVSVNWCLTVRAYLYEVTHADIVVAYRFRIRALFVRCTIQFCQIL